MYEVVEPELITSIYVLVSNVDLDVLTRELSKRLDVLVEDEKFKFCEDLLFELGVEDLDLVLTKSEKIVEFLPVLISILLKVTEDKIFEELAQDVIVKVLKLNKEREDKYVIVVEGVDHVVEDMIFIRKVGNNEWVKLVKDVYLRTRGKHVYTCDELRKTVEELVNKVKNICKEVWS